MPRIIFFLYRAAQTAATPFLLLYLGFRYLKNRAYGSRLAERFGFVSHLAPTVPGGVWLHAVSVGEVNSAVPLLEALRRAAPGVRIYVSVGTIAGRQLAEQRLNDLASAVFYAPFDFVWCVRRALRALRPAIVVVMETEIWPNLWRETKRSGAGLLLVNARISDRALNRYRRLTWFFRPVLELPDAILAQDDEASTRYRGMGAPSGRVRVIGNLKYDFSADPASLAPVLREAIAASKPGIVWIAASTMPARDSSDVDEEPIVLDALAQLSPAHRSLLLILVPRRPERFELVAEDLDRRGIPFARRSSLKAGDRLPLPGVLLLDSIGELAALFALADIVFMGGTIANRGGHNILEPASFGKPVIAGPHLENFAAIAARFRAENALVEAGDAASLAAAVDTLIRDPVRRHQIGAAGERVARSQTGATPAAVEAIVSLLDASLPARPPSVWRFPLAPLSWLWRAGSVSARRRQRARSQRLPVPVISVGGVAMGGSGKTPFAIAVARTLWAEGVRPGFLTRGYKRQLASAVVVAPPRGELRAGLTGDEARILLRSGLGPVGISGNRFRAGTELLARFPVDALVLDDGFQHWRLARDLDVVLIDTLDPFSDGVFPVGRLREPLSALFRADAVVLTRCLAGRNYTGIERAIRRCNTRAPILHSEIVPLDLVNASSGAALGCELLREHEYAAFCGLGNPASFLATLDGLGARLRGVLTFPDHHPYSETDLARIAALAERAGARILVTTEKDAANLPNGAATGLGEARLYFLRVAAKVREQEEWRDLLLRVVHSSRRPARGAVQ